MKKIIAIALAIVMMAAMSVVVLADNPSYNDNVTAEGGNNCTVSYGMTEGYVVKIPSAIDLTDGAVDAEVGVSNLKLAANKDLTVAVSAAATYYYDNSWFMAETGDTGAADVEFFIKKAGSDVESTDVVLTAFTGTRDYDNEEEVTLAFSTEGTTHVADYTATITFTVATAVVDVD